MVEGTSEFRQHNWGARRPFIEKEAHRVRMLLSGYADSTTGAHGGLFVYEKSVPYLQVAQLLEKQATPHSTAQASYVF